MPYLRVFREESNGFEAELERLGRRGELDLVRVEEPVRGILAGLRQGGDAALADYVRRFEHRSPEPLFERDYGGRAALESLSPALQAALTLAASRIQSYHEQQMGRLGSVEYTDREGVLLSSRVRPLASVGVYAPGGKARYPSSVLMSAVVAKVAGVPEILLACPNPCPEVRAAAYLSGVTGLLNAGGAQAVAALAYGTESIPRVAKIVGPGNVWVTCAKKLVFGDVAIDGIAGPSEILVLADASADPKVVAADLLSQAEHDEDAYALLACTSEAWLADVEQALEAELSLLPRKEIAEASLAAHGAAFLVADVKGLVRVADALSVEHVSVQCPGARDVADAIQCAGAIFIGHHTPEAAGDYLAGPSHVLPTGGAARFGAPLGVYDFVSRTSLIGYSREALLKHSGSIVELAQAEGLDAHARAVTVRTQ